MKVNFNDKDRTLKALDGTTIRQNRLEILVAMKATELIGQQVLDVRQAVKILEEKGVKVSDVFEENGKPLTLKSICTDVLNAPEVNERGERKESWKTRYEKGELMKEIWEAKEPISFTSDKIKMIKDLLAKSSYSNIILHQAFDWLEGEGDEAKKDDKK